MANHKRLIVLKSFTSQITTPKFLRVNLNTIGYAIQSGLSRSEYKKKIINEPAACSAVSAVHLLQVAGSQTPFVVGVKGSLTTRSVRTALLAFRRVEHIGG